MRDPTLTPRALILVNPKARQGWAGVSAAVERLGRRRISALVESFEAFPELARDIVRMRETVDLLVVCGGDGTVSSSSIAVMESGLPLGIIPTGTANDLARTLGIPMDLGDAAEVIAQGHTRAIDLGSVNGHGFFNVASIGLSTTITQKIDPQLKKRWGRLGYAFAASKILGGAEHFKATIVEKGQSIDVETYQIAVGNGRHYGGGNVVASTAEIDDGHLDLYSLEMKNLWKMALMLRSFRTGRHGAWREVRTARCTEFDIGTRKPMPVNADGEIVTSTPAHFKVHPNAISIFVPRGGALP